MTDIPRPLPRLIEKLNEAGKAVLVASGGRLPQEAMRERGVLAAVSEFQAVAREIPFGHCADFFTRLGEIDVLPGDYVAAFTALARDAHETGPHPGNPSSA